MSDRLLRVDKMLVKNAAKSLDAATDRLLKHPTLAWTLIENTREVRLLTWTRLRRAWTDPPGSSLCSAPAMTGALRAIATWAAGL